MNKTKTLLIAIAVVGTASAQKAKVVSAYNYNKAFERDKDCAELKKGIDAIESATTDIKTKEWAKTWYYGGNLYFNAALTEDAECVKKFDGALDKSLEFYTKALKYNIKDGSAKDLDIENNQADMMKFMGKLMDKNTVYTEVSYVRDIMGIKFPHLANAFLNLGYSAFESGDYKTTKEYSLKSIGLNGMLGKVDTLGMLNAAISAERLEEYDEALGMYSMLTQINYGGADIYSYMASIYDKQANQDKKKETIEAGLKKFPNDENLKREQLSIMLASGDTDNALTNLDQAIANENDNHTLYYNRGLILDGKKEYEKAAKDYIKAFEIDPTFFDAAYNLGAMYFNQGVEWNNKASSYDLSETSKYETATKEANKYFALAQKPLEDAHVLDPKDKPTMASLVKIYAIIGEDDKYSEMKKKLGQ